MAVLSALLSLQAEHDKKKGEINSIIAVIRGALGKEIRDLAMTREKRLDLLAPKQFRWIIEQTQSQGIAITWHVMQDGLVPRCFFSDSGSKFGSPSEVTRCHETLQDLLNFLDHRFPGKLASYFA